MAFELQTNFSFGELSPNLQGFTDMQAFKRGALTLQNFYNTQTGGVRFREGSYYSANSHGNLTGKLIPFVFNNQQAYVLEFTNNNSNSGRLRFHTNGGQLQISYAISAASWSAGVVSFTIPLANTFYIGDTITVTGMTPSAYNGTYVINSWSGGGTIANCTLASNPGTATVFGNMQGPYQLTTPYAAPPLTWTQIDDLMYLADGINPIQVLSRLGSVNWTIAPVTFLNGPWGNVQNNTNATLSISGSTITASKATFAATDVGRLILWLDVNDTFNGSSGAWKWATITAYTNATTVTVGNWAMGTGTSTNCVPPSNPQGPYTVSGVTWASTNGGQSTYTIGAHSITAGMQVDITGINPPLYNGTSLNVTGVTGTTITVLNPNNPGTYVSGGSVALSNANFWALGAWSATTGYPSMVTMHQQRLVAGNSPGFPQTFWGSMVGQFSDMSPFDPDGTVNPDNAYSFQVSSGRADAIFWMEADTYLMIGTGYGEYLGNSSGPAITPADISVQKQTNLGASVAGLRPVLMNYRAIIPQRGNQFLYDWRYNWQYGKCVGTRMNALADHILRPNVTVMDLARVPIETIWIARADGVMVAAVDTGEQWAFSRHILGGNGAVVESLCVIPGNTGNYDQLWMLVKRTVNNQTVRFVEYLTQPFIPASGSGAAQLTNAFFVDAGQTYNGAPTNTFSGFGYLQGETVSILADGVSLGNVTVPSNGIITTAQNHSVVSIGLPYTGTLQTMHIAQAEVQGRRLLANIAYSWFQYTQGGTIAGTDGNAVPIAEAASTAPGINGGLFSGYSRIVLGSNWQPGQSVTISQQSPLPMTILNVMLDYGVGST